MKSIIIYAIGKRFYQWFQDENFCYWLSTEDIKIVGLVDKKVSIQGNCVKVCNEIKKIKDITEYSLKDIDGIIITSDIYFDEIKQNLLNYGYIEEQIFSLDYYIEKYLEGKYPLKQLLGKYGIEIGGPTKIFSIIYKICSTCDGVNFSTDTVWWKKEEKYKFENNVLGNVLIADATDLHIIKDATYDFILSSNNLEHIANPLKALKEFSRICKKNGVIVVQVPRKEKTFDHNREYTTFEHILNDFKIDVTENDLTHLSEIIDKHDYDMDDKCGGKDKFFVRAQNNFENRCLHHHVFNEDCLRKMFEMVGLKVITFSQLGNDWLIIGQV